jgi:hypothetical protein
MQKHVEQHAVACVNMEYILENRQMAGTGYGKKFRKSLDQSEENSL